MAKKISEEFNRNIEKSFSDLDLVHRVLIELMLIGESDSFEDVLIAYVTHALKKKEDSE